MTWTELKSDIADWLNRTDLESQIPKFIQLAEAEFNRELRVPDMEITETDTMAGGELVLPGAFLGMKAVYLTYEQAGDPVKVPLSQMSLQQLRTDYPFEPSTETTVPSFYALTANTMIFGPPPDDDYEVTFTYYFPIPALSDIVSTNWLLDSHRDLYMNAAQWQASIFLRDWQAVDYFRSETGRLIEAVKKQGIKKAMGASSITIPSPVRQLYMPGVRV